MKITEQQLQTLRSLHCERLSCNDDNLRLIDQFFNSTDVSEDEKLVSHYIDDMNFRIPDDLATTKPVYDFACRFMCQEVKLLESGRQAFLDNFNPDEV